MVQGQGDHTPEKQYGLEKLLGQWMAIIDQIKRKEAAGIYKPSLSEIIRRPAIYIDMNAGCGYNYEVNCIGSPLMFASLRSGFGFDIDAYFLESDPASVHSLRSALPGADGKFEIVHCDSNEGIFDIIQQKDKSYGLIYHDPNGVPSFDALGKLSQLTKCHFVDFLIRLSGTNYKRVRRGLNEYGKKNNIPELISKYPTLEEQPRMIKKKEWLIRNIIDPDPQQWTFLFGTNWTNYPAWEKHGFYKISSPTGSSILRRVNYTIDELKK